MQSEQRDASAALDFLMKAARFSGSCAGLLNSVGGALWQPERAFHEQTLKLIQSNLDLPAFEVAFGEGQPMSMDETITYIVSE